MATTISDKKSITCKELLPCPFCGANAEPLDEQGKIKTLDSVELCRQLESAQPYGLITIEKTVYFAKCQSCGAAGGRAAAGYNPTTDRTTTEAEAISRAIEKWNRRQA